MKFHQQSESSVHQVLQLIRSIKQDSHKDKQLSSLDFSMQSDWRQPLRNRTFNRGNVFDRLFKESKQKQQRKQLIAYQVRRSKQQRDRQQCTFSPNISMSKRVSTNYDSCDNQSFYNKNIEWLQRKQKSIKLLQCQKNQQNHQQFSFTPKINKPKIHKEEGILRKGVQDYYNRQKKAKTNKNFVQQRRQNPYSHVWTVKKGCFSNPYLR